MHTREICMQGVEPDQEKDRAELHEPFGSKATRPGAIGFRVYLLGFGPVFPDNFSLWLRNVLSSVQLGYLKSGHMGSHSWSPVCDSIFFLGGNLGCTALLEEVVGGRLRELITYNSLQFLLCDVSWEYDLCVPGTCLSFAALPPCSDGLLSSGAASQNKLLLPPVAFGHVSYYKDRKASNTKQ